MKALEIAPRLPAYVERLGEAAAELSAPRDAADIPAMVALVRQESRLTRWLLLFAGLSALILAGAVVFR